jgi:hypothetical protein
MSRILIQLAFGLADERDGSGVYGGILHYGLIMAFMGSALLAFVYFWRKGRLDMDEEPKIAMMKNDEDEEPYGR